ncbi:MAG: HDOD domain-containing protein [Syntrophales bacterium]|nr:HDOD domain-containing protein [Syntrophales bacterium]MDD5642075.1 HDOD domain-containing protein [Syntrophales bacterium]
MSLVPQVLRSLKNLPPFPMVAQRALLLLNKPEVSIQELVEVVKFDPAVTANILRISNSAYFGLRREIHSLHQALLLLGTQELLKIIIASGATRLFSAPTPGYFTERQGLWRHSVSCALMVDLLSREISLPDQATGFTAGLMHDIGKVVLSLFVEQKFHEIMEVVEKEGVPFQAAEKIILGVDHAEMGGEMARMWDFPDRLRLAITYHHLDKPEAYTDDLTLLVYLGDILTMMFGQDLGADGLAYTGYPEVLRHFHLREKNLQKILLQFGSAWDEAQVFFGLMGNQDGVQCANRG